MPHWLFILTTVFATLVCVAFLGEWLVRRTRR